MRHGSSVNGAILGGVLGGMVAAGAAIAAPGDINTIAGGGALFPGNGAPATAVRLNGPYGMAVDADDNIFVADTYSNLIRRIDQESGVITTVAGGKSLHR